MTAELRVAGLTHRYGDRQILDIPELVFPAGEITAIVGPSGAGKSTLLRLLNFLERPESGQIYLDDLPLQPDPDIAVRRRITTVFQRPILLRRSVKANMAYGLGLRGQSVNDGLINGWLEKIGLAGQGNQLATRLSAGEMQRVALARGMILKPDVLLLDEPTANLDPANVALIEHLVKEDQQARQTTVIIVTHNLFQARRLSDQLLVLIEGRVGDMGPAERVFEQPAGPQTAAFLKGDLIF